MAVTSPRLMALRAAATQRPDDPFPRYALAQELRSLGDAREAWTVLAALLDDHPDYVPGYAPAGELARLHGESSRARALFERGIEAASRKGDSHTAQRLREALDDLGEDR